jgi:hypothetical protein
MQRSHLYCSDHIDAGATVVQEEFDRIYRSYFTNTEALLARTRMQADGLRT